MDEKNSAKVVMVISTKGGVGKSTIAQQIAATYFLGREEPVRLIEIDDENLDASYLTNSKVSASQMVVGNAGFNSLADEMTVVLSEGENLVIDVGGNKTATGVISSLGRNGSIMFVDLFIVPISGPGQDVTNALRTAKMIREVKPDALIVLAVTRIPFGESSFVRKHFERYYEVQVLEEQFLDVCFLPAFDSMIYSRALGTTFYEIFASRDRTLQQITQQMIEAKRKHDQERMTQYARIREAVSDAGAIYPYIKDFHAVIEKHLVQ